MQQIQLLTLIERVVTKKKVSYAELSRGLKISNTSVLTMMRRNTMQVQRLAELSEFLQYNFFREIADSLPYAEPMNKEYQDEKGQAVQTRAELENRIKELELEISIMRRTWKDISGK